MSETILILANGAAVDLLDPFFNPRDLDALAEQIAKEKRFNGATAGVEYSVAEHLCLGTDQMLASDDPDIRAAAPYFLVHDLHEAVWKDDTTPKKRAIGAIAQSHFGVLAEHIVEAFELAVYRLDAVLHEACGLRWPMPAALAPIVKHYDRMMLATEWKAFMGGAPLPEAYAGVPLLKLTLDRSKNIDEGEAGGVWSAWRWQTAKAAWLRRAEALLPALRSSGPGAAP